MITIAKLLVEPIKSNSLLVSWEFKQTLEDFNNYEFTLQRSYSPEDNFEDVITFTDKVFYMDEVNNIRLWNDIHYRIKSKNITNEDVEYSDSSTIGLPPNSEALEIVRRLDILLSNRRHGVGVPCAVFLHKKAGPSCECWDPDKKKMRRSNCDDCYGTRFVGGYYEPILAWINFSPDAKSNPIPEWGETEPNEKQVLMSNYPPVNPRDIVLNPYDFTAYVVTDNQTTDRRMFTMQQMLRLKYLDRNHVRYQLFEDYANEVAEIKKISQEIINKG